MNEKWFVIINPVSGGKKAPKIWRKIKPLFDEALISYEFVFTEYLDHAAQLSEQATKSGYKNFIIIGGDGTTSDVINGIFNSMVITNDIVVAMIAAGTGNDWVRTIGTFKNIKEIPAAIKNKNTFKHDVGIIYFNDKGIERKRYFINIAGLGFEGYVVKKLRGNNDYLKGGKLQYWFAILRSLMYCKHTLVTIEVDGIKNSMKTLSIACGICNYNGAGLKQLPKAVFDDGLLDMTIIGDMSKFEMVVNLPKLINGSHVKLKQVKTYRGRGIKIVSDIPVYVEADGEFLGETPVRLCLIQMGINVLKWD